MIEIVDWGSFIQAWEFQWQITKILHKDKGCKRKQKKEKGNECVSTR